MNALTEVMAERVVELEKQKKELVANLQDILQNFLTHVRRYRSNIATALANAKEATK